METSFETERTHNGAAQQQVLLVQSVAERIVQHVSKVIIGKRNEILLTVLGLVCKGHLLIEDIPGVGKTMLAKALAQSIGCHFSRIQFTPDMLPSDVTGVSLFNQQTREFEFRSGPIMLRSCWRMKSIAPLRKRRRPCSKSWRSSRSPSTE